MNKILKIGTKRLNIEFEYFKTDLNIAIDNFNGDYFADIDLTKEEIIKLKEFLNSLDLDE